MYRNRVSDAVKIREGGLEGEFKSSALMYLLRLTQISSSTLGRCLDCAGGEANKMSPRALLRQRKQNPKDQGLLCLQRHGEDDLRVNTLRESRGLFNFAVSNDLHTDRQPLSVSANRKEDLWVSAKGLCTFLSMCRWACSQACVKQMLIYLNTHSLKYPGRSGERLARFSSVLLLLSEASAFVGHLVHTCFKTPAVVNLHKEMVWFVFCTNHRTSFWTGSRPCQLEPSPGACWLRRLFIEMVCVCRSHYSITRGRGFCFLWSEVRALGGCVHVEAGVPSECCWSALCQPENRLSCTQLHEKVDVSQTI